MKMNIDRVFEETVAKVKQQKTEAAQKAAAEEKCEKEEETRKTAERKEEIKKLLTAAQKNIDALTKQHAGNEKFLGYFTALFEKKATGHNEQKFITKNYRHPKKQGGGLILGTLEQREVFFFLLSVASSGDKDAGSAVNVVLRTGRAGTFEWKVDPKRSSVEVLVMTYDHDFKTGTTEWHLCEMYENKKLDATLRALAKSESTIRLLVEEFGTLVEWKEEEY